jgi:hypothetical protein
MWRLVWPHADACPVPSRAVCTGAVVDLPFVLDALSELTVVSGVAAAAARAPSSVRDVMRAEFLASPRAAPEAVLARLREMA